MNQDLLKVCQVVHTLNVGGAEILAREYALRSRDQCNTLFACLDEIGSLGENLRRDGQVVETLGRQSGFDFAVARKLARLCREHNVDVIHAQQYTPFFYAALSRIPFGGPPILFTEHGRSFPDYRRSKRVFANKVLLRRCDHIVAVGKQVKQALIDNEGISANRIEVIYNGIDINAFRHSPGVRAEVRQELGISDADIAVFQVARLNALKDHGTAVRTWARLTDCPTVRLFLVGDGEERPSIERLIDKLGLHRSITLLGTRNDVPRLINAADMFLMTSVSEGIPLTLIEAMANGVPCVSTDAGGIAEVVLDGVTGLLSPAGDDAAIAASVMRLAKDADLRKRMGEQGCERAETLFSDSTMHAAYQGLYRQMSSSGTRREFR
ncbi:glycosyltransferase [Novipirellula artificiosorum]|uniref:Putative glycosyltransferase EpsD n=1 Tax=Novipirellula artificiosorum TaxID=2528016 RepID=A0A5C6D008_9BACT|nr:glycosyltransferase [Novipirellula artificiosorum]TWU29154.1 putative glycosyltransferase EpsD [Novipirellula artificiosorum]